LASTLSPCAKNCAWFWDVAKRHIDAKAMSLSPDEIDDAEEYGRQLDLQATVDELLTEFTFQA
jgi:hypothetical protein